MSEESDWKQKYLNDPRTNEELVDLALKEEDGDARWDLVTILIHRDPQKIFETAKHLCESKSSNEIKLGADLLGQLSKPDNVFHEESLSILFRIVDEETDANVLQSATVALGHLDNIRAVEHLVKLKNHPSEDVRHGVVFGLLTYEDERAIAALIELSKDEDDDVRSWATFGLGTQIDTDTPEIRDTLFARVEEGGDDNKDEIRGEAFVGLARRGDKRVIEPLLKELTSDSVGKLAVEAAKEIADSRLLPALLSLKEWWDVDKELLDEAILACQSESKAESN